MEKKNNLQGVTFNGSVTFNGPMIDIHDNQRVEVYMQGNTPKQVDEEEYEFVDMEFFDRNRFNTLEKQNAFRRILKNILPRIDADNGRDWITVYIAYHYYIDKLAMMVDYVPFFADIERLMPGVLTKVNKEADKGYKRYKAYTDLIRLETPNWFIINGCLPPMLEWTSTKYNYGVDIDRKRHIQKLVKEIYQGLKQMVI